MNNTTYSLHLSFKDGSNPYVRYGMNRQQYSRELLKWKRNYIVTIDKIENGLVFATAERKESHEPQR